MKTLVIAFYKFVSLPDYKDLREPLLERCLQNNIRGSILLATEGINGTIAGPEDGMNNVLEYIRSNPRFADLEYKQAHVSPDHRTFYRMKVRLKKEIVTLGQEGIDPNETVGQYVTPEQWNQLIDDPDVVLIDTRNDYEVDVGTFKGAINPHTKSFREFPEFVNQNLDPTVHKKVAMFCTGGIRCEKATAFMLKQGFQEVYHLKGGILKYLEEVPEEKSSWEGECYVFDNRVAVNHNLEPGSYELCFACRRPLSPEDKEFPEYEPGVSCRHCITEYSAQDRERFAERMRQIQFAKERKEQHIGE